MNRTGNPCQLAVLCLLLVGAILATFWPVRHHEFINFDDPDYVTENDWVKRGLHWEGTKWAFTTGHASNWHPITWLSHMLDVQLFGLNPQGHHGMNVGLHAVNSVLLLLLLYQMTGTVWRSAIVAILFGLHPLHVESVAWVAERKDVLSTLFGLLCLMSYGAYARCVSNNQTTPHPTLSPVEAERVIRRSKVAYVLAFAFLALGLMSKPMLVTWPFVMLLLDFWPLQRVTGDGWQVTGNVWKQLALEKVPFLLLVIVSCVVTVLVQAKGGAVTTALNLPLDDRLENAVASCVKYLSKAVWPTNLAIFYPHPETRYPMSDQWPLWVIGLATASLAGACVLTIRRRNQQPYLLTGWFWYLGTLIPVIGIVQVGTQAMADRYTYIPLIGVFVVTVWGLADLLKWYSLAKPVGPAVALAVAIACVIVSRNQITHWQNSFTVFSHAAAVTRHNAPAHGNLGTEYVKRGEVDEGIRHFKAALEADPHFADAAYSLGLVEQNRGNLEPAAGYYRDALSRRPGHVLGNHNLGTVLWLQGNLPEAEIQFRKGLELKPDHLEANVNLGNLLLELRRPAEARPYLERALQLSPGNLDVRLGLGLTAKMQGQSASAIEQFRQILATNPDNLEATLNLGIVLAAMGQSNEAAIHFQQVTQTKPSLGEELILSGRTLAAQGKVHAALDKLTAATYLSPTNTTALETLGQMQAQLGNLDEAARTFERSIELTPGAEAYYFLGAVRALQGNAPAAVTNFNHAIQLKPDFLAALNELAWMLATHPDGKVRDGSKAVELAERACKLAGTSEARYWGTLDAAYAETGRFAEAIQTAEKARNLALASNQPELAATATERVSRYRAGKPFHQQ